MVENLLQPRSVEPVRYLVVSDLHLGALNSVLTNVADSGTAVDREAPSPALSALGACLASLTARGAPPELVVLGDLFELALTPLDDAAATFAHFARALGLGTPGGAVARQLRFVAGNHDHHMWTRARMEHDARIVRETPRGQPLQQPEHVTAMFDDPAAPPVRARFIEALVEWSSDGASIEAVHSYPNFGLVDGSGERAIVMHHGHFVEHLYRIVSSLDDLFGDPSRGRSASELERENAGWIDFFWSSEGDSGDAGMDVRVLYESLVSGRTIDAEINRASRLLGRGRRGFVARLERYVATRLALRAHHTLAQRERHHSQAVLSRDADTGLEMYLGGPVRNELVSALGRVPADTTFLFGHTHKPFVATRGVTGYPRPVTLVNTGGWVVDHPEPEPLKGATAVLIDADLRTVALELYRQRADGTVAPPAAVAVGSVSVPWAEAVQERMAADQSAWAGLTTALDEAVAARRRQLLERDAATEARIAKADAAAPAEPPETRRATSGCECES